MKDFTIKKAGARKLDARLNQPFKIATGAHTALENVLFYVQLDGGITGWGEAAPAAHITGETQEKTLSNLQNLARGLEGRSVCDYQAVSMEISESLPQNRCARTAVEAAMLDALAQKLKMPVWKLFGPGCAPLHSDMTIVLGSVEEAQLAAKDIKRRGMSAYKIKLGGDAELDFMRILAAANAAPEMPVYLDANQAYSPKGMLRLVRELKDIKVRLEMIEQPVKKEDWEGLREVTRKSGVCVCADEAVTGLESVARIIRGGYAHAVNIKTAKFGFVLGAEMARLCRAHGIRLMIGGMMESLLAMTASAHLAAGCGGFDFIDLDTPFFIKDKVMRGGALSPSGVYSLAGVKSGLGVAPAD
ncbi:MAG: dipeptide epimerase [Elusimicrobiales bacterium]